MTKKKAKDFLPFFIKKEEEDNHQPIIQYLSFSNLFLIFSKRNTKISILRCIERYFQKGFPVICRLKLNSTSCPFRKTHHITIHYVSRKISIESR